MLAALYPSPALHLCRSAIASAPVVVFSKSYCPYCVKAERALSTFAMKPGAMRVIQLEGMANASAIQAALGQMTGASTVPRVFINHKFLGGGDDTAAAAANGTLKRLLTEAGALA